MRNSGRSKRLVAGNKGINMKCEIGKGKYEIDGELINDLIESIQMNLSVFYDDHNGP